MIRKNSLEARIYAGFAVLAALLLVTGIVSSMGLAQLRTSREDIRDVETANASALLIDRDVQELRMRVDRYVAYGGQSQLDAVDEVYGSVAEQLASASAQTQDAQMLSLFEAIRGHVAQYASHIPTIGAERNLRRTLVQVEMPRQAERVEAAFANLAGAAGADNGVALALAQSKTSFLKAERSLSRYFDNPDTGTVNQAVAYLRDAAAIVAAPDMPPSARAMLIEQIDEFERIALRAVQTTRSYLFFLNVVMAGEASEVAHYASELRELAAQRRRAIATRSVATSRNTTSFTASMMAIALALTLFLSVRLAFLIVPPVRMLTHLFEKLAAGATDVDIPYTKRSDEIGRMAKAARAFSDQNRKTQALLEESEALRGELEIKSARLESSNRELDDFAYVASHDLRSPLRSIGQLAAWVGEDAGDVLSAESIRHLDLLVGRIGKMDSLLEDLLNYSRVGRAEPEAECVDVSRMLASIVELTDNPHDVQIVFPPNLPTIRVAAPPLEQVLRNMIGNSVKHCDKGADGRVDVSFAIEGAWCRFRVTDNGPGIDPADHARAFQIYQRVGSTKVEGSGMGLAIIKKLVETRSGVVTLESRPGEGAVFEFTWPLGDQPCGEQQRLAS